MKIALVGLGSRGDMEPLLSIGKLLKSRNHHVLCILSDEFKIMVSEMGMGFASLGSEHLELMYQDEGKEVFGGRSRLFPKILSSIRFGVQHSKIEPILIQRQYNIITRYNPDIIIHNRLAIYPFIWGLQHSNKSILLEYFPYTIHYVKEHANIFFNKDYGPFFNKLTYILFNIYLSRQIKKYSGKLNLPFKKSGIEIRQAITTGKTIYNFSEALFTKPRNWNKKAKITGFLYRQKSKNWSPPEKLQQFLSQHDKIVFITFGSMPNPDPLKKTKTFMEILESNNTPAIFSTCAGGLQTPESYNSQLFYFIKSIPYDWILPRVYAIIHHGGCGTTHDGILSACPTLIIPHFMDQHVWNKIIFEKKLGPLGTGISTFSKEKIEPLIKDLISNDTYRKNVLKTSEEMKKENLKQGLYNFIFK